MFLFVPPQLPFYYLIDNLTFQHHTYHKVKNIKGIQTRGPLKMCEKLGNWKNRSSKNPGNLKWFLRRFKGPRK